MIVKSRDYLCDMVNKGVSSWRDKARMKKKQRRRVWSNYLNGLQRTDYSIDHSRGYTE